MAMAGIRQTFATEESNEPKTSGIPLRFFLHCRQLMREQSDVTSKLFHPQICMCPFAVVVVVVAYRMSQFQKSFKFPF